MVKKQRTRRDITYDNDNSQESGDIEGIEADPENTNSFTSQFNIKPNSRFLNYKEIFENLSKSKNVPTTDPIVSVDLSYDQESCLTVTKKDDREYNIKIYRLSDYEVTFEEKIGGKPKNYIKLKEIEQNSDGSKYAFAYMDDGKFRIRTFHNKNEQNPTRADSEIKRNEFDLNKALGIDDFTMPISGFPDPFVVCCFIGDNDNKLMVALFHNKTKVHYHFIYDDARKKIESDIVQMKMDCTPKNFPYRVFANDEQNESYIFYRQGQVLTINNSDPNDY